MPDGGQKAAAAKSASDKSADKSGDRAAQAGGVQSLARALSLLKGLAGSDRGRTLTDLARHTGLAPSTAHRLLGTLQQEGFARFDQSDMRWYVGVEAFSVGISFARHRDIATMARPYMVRLMEESGETANLAVERDGVIVYLAQVECRHMMRALAGPGARVPLHSSAAGKVYLAGRLGGAPVMPSTMKNMPSVCAASPLPFAMKRARPSPPYRFPAQPCGSAAISSNPSVRWSGKSLTRSPAPMAVGRRRARVLGIVRRTLRGDEARHTLKLTAAHTDSPGCATVRLPDVRSRQNRVMSLAAYSAHSSGLM